MFVGDANELPLKWCCFSFENIYMVSTEREVAAPKRNNHRPKSLTTLYEEHLYMDARSHQIPASQVTQSVCPGCMASFHIIYRRKPVIRLSGFTQSPTVEESYENGTDIGRNMSSILAR